ncbi:MAG TPA: hypothetical protein VGH34_18805 [Vicinamibacterales bacterium]
MRTRVLALLMISLLFTSGVVRAQEDPSPWMLMSDGVLFATYNHQGSPRGGDEFKSTNWWMGMASRTVGPGRLTLTGMLSLDALTATSHGYREIFQVGEEYHGAPLVDWQHPHDFLMQAAIAWRVPIDYRSGFTIAAAPVGEAALGPVAYMHRASATDNPTAPLAHHTLDSTHISMGVITTGFDHGPWTIEGSLFNGREPDDNRWDLMDPGPLDSWSARVWYEPSPAWQFQVSQGLLKHPEPLEPGSIRRTTASASWTARRPTGFTAATFAFGLNQKEQGAYTAYLAEAEDRRGRTSIYGRFESVDTETALLQNAVVFASGSDLPPSRVNALTFGLVRDLAVIRGFEFGIGGDVVLYGVPDALRPEYGDHPVSAHVFIRVRLPAGHMGRMWNMRMAGPM